ncbi:MAG: cephalosporin hydroxylase family protein [Beijerinckiaceae bacterium]|nr:cephalosporin hydroxylase family protein [Beijerinckiaceae bacterium]MCZ8301270.1 cephalosporin hydroxylase family protein [Beijerinckiaceae bacterium]
MDPVKQFAEERLARLEAYQGDTAFRQLSQAWLEASMRKKYVYNFDWLGRPIIQYPQDMWAVQELIWQVKPDLVIETGIAHGGSLILSASILAMLDYCDAMAAGTTLDPRQTKRKVIGIDIDIRPHNRAALDAHPLRPMLHLVEGSSISAETVAAVKAAAAGHKTIMVFLDSMHTHAHVLAELEAYAPMVSKGSYCVVFDSFVEDMPADLFPDRPWSPGDNPMTAMREYLEKHPEFVTDKSIEGRLMVTVAAQGFLKRVG